MLLVSGLHRLHCEAWHPLVGSLRQQQCVMGTRWLARPRKGQAQLRQGASFSVSRRRRASAHSEPLPQAA